MVDVTIIDYGINNLKSVSKAFEKIEKSIKITDRSEDILSANCLILPGIGAFGDGMKELKNRKLVEPIKQRMEDQIPLLGICLGMQMLFSESEEFGIHKGLNFIPGRVVSFKHPKNINIQGYRVPHMGWNTLKPNNGFNWNDTILQDLKVGSEVYFVHSFYPIVQNKEDILAITEYGGQKFCSVVRRNNITGTQFHPEKSGEVGLSILKTFCEVNKI